MNNIKNILIPTDFSNVSQMALEYAANLVQSDHTVHVTLLHILNEDISPEKAERQLKDLRATYQELIPAMECQVTHGGLIDSVLEGQKTYKANLIIMGTKGSTEEESVAMTLTSELVTEANCPVLVIPPRKQEFRVRNIALALGTDDMDSSLALGVLFDIARAFDAKVHILSVLKEGEEPRLNERNQSILEYYFQTLDYHHAFPHNSDIEEGISNYVKQNDINLLAIMPRNHATKSTPSEGRLTKLLTMHAQVPLLTID